MHFQGTCVLASKTSASSTGPPSSHSLNDIKYQSSSHILLNRPHGLDASLSYRWNCSSFLLVRVSFTEKRAEIVPKMMSHLLLECRRWRSSLLYGLRPFDDQAAIDRFNSVRNNVFLVISLTYRWARLVPNPFLISLIRGLPPGCSLKWWTLWGCTYHESHQTRLLKRRICQNIMSMTPNMDFPGWHSDLQPH